MFKKALIFLAASVALFAQDEAANAVPAPVPSLGAASQNPSAATVEIPTGDPVTTEQFKQIVSDFEGEWEGEIRASAIAEIQEDGTEAKRGEIPGRIIKATLLYVKKEAADKSWQLAVTTHFGKGDKQTQLSALTFLKGGILHSTIQQGTATTTHTGQLYDGKIIWRPLQSNNQSVDISSEWIDNSGSQPCLRTQTFQVFKGEKGPITIRLDGYFYRTERLRVPRKESMQTPASQFAL